MPNRAGGYDRLCFARSLNFFCADLCRNNAPRCDVLPVLITEQHFRSRTQNILFDNEILRQQTLQKKVALNPHQSSQHPELAPL